ncbi:hypothetical protein LINPERPRIM_LOCUS22273, partial [Linum perenne]
SDRLLDDLTKALSLRCLQLVKQEYYLVKNKLENLIRV